MTWSVRTPVCPHCGLILDRDQNAALLLREVGLARAIAQGVWAPKTPRVSQSGTVGHTVTERWGTAGLLRGCCGAAAGLLRGGALPRLAEPSISRIYAGRVSIPRVSFMKPSAFNCCVGRTCITRF